MTFPDLRAQSQLSRRALLEMSRTLPPCKITYSDHGLLPSRCAPSDVTDRAIKI
jgi:hypothetical protein